MSERNGTLGRWLLGIVTATLIATLGAIQAVQNSRITDVEQTQRQRGDRVITLESQVTSLREQLCRMEGKIDDLREDITGTRVYRRPCP